MKLRHKLRDRGEKNFFENENLEKLQTKNKRAPQNLTTGLYRQINRTRGESIQRNQVGQWCQKTKASD